MVEFFDSHDEEYKKPFGAICDNQMVIFTVHWECQSSVILTVMKEDTGLIHSINMNRISDDLWIAEYRFIDIGLYFYRFEGDSRYIVKTPNSSKGILSDSFDNEWFIQLVYAKEYIAPSNMAGRVIYQIFPDRFYHRYVIETGLEERQIHQDLNITPSYMEVGQDMKNNDFFGGNLDGIKEKLSYLKELGVGIIYLNPIFLSHSNHRYDTSDYFKVDPLLGTNEDFKELCDSAKELDISIVLDGVFSHTGADSIYFDRFHRYGSTGAYANINSRYRNWYFFDDSEIGYRCWWGVYTLPEIDEDNISFRDFICGEDGVIDYWMSLGASGFRLDVADELPDSFICDIRKAIKKHGDEKILIGEVWENAVTKVSYNTRRRYLWGEELDSVMNYPFRESIIDFVRFGNAQEFMGSIMEIVECYPKPMMDIMMNLLSTHDTQRLINALVAPFEDRPRSWQANRVISKDEYLYSVEMAKLAFTILFTLPGIPSIYYGDEIGMTGYGDPFNRGYFRWDEIDYNIREYIVNLSRIRREHSVFREGKMIPLYYENSVVAYLRENPSQSVLVVVNRSEVQNSFNIRGRTFITNPWRVTIELLKETECEH